MWDSLPAWPTGGTLTSQRPVEITAILIDIISPGYILYILNLKYLDAKEIQQKIFWFRVVFIRLIVKDQTKTVKIYVVDFQHPVS